MCVCACVCVCVCVVCWWLPSNQRLYRLPQIKGSRGATKQQNSYLIVIVPWRIVYASAGVGVYVCVCVCEEVAE